jgi:23S rRNA pseudouridine2457 synthase
MRLLVLNKPFHVLTRFTAAGDRRTLAAFVRAPGVYPAGRLDYDSEGVLLLTDDGRLQSLITDPRHALVKTYWAQVEGVVGEPALARLRAGVTLADGRTRPAGAAAMLEPVALWPRQPPIRRRAVIPTSWLELRLSEGRNRQVRRMTAAVGLPTLRLVRAAVGPFTIDRLAPGEWQEIPEPDALAWRAELERLSGRADRSASRPRAPVRSSAAGRRSSGRPARDPRR